MNTLLLSPEKTKKDLWYKEPWLLLVLGGPLAVVVAAVFTGFIAFNGADPVVSKDYYRQGLMVNKDIIRDANAKAQQVEAQIKIDQLAGQVVVQLSAKSALPEKLKLSLALNDGKSVLEKVRRLELSAQGNGRYLAEWQAHAEAQKTWHIKLEGGDWRLTGDWVNPLNSELQLSANKSR